MSRMLIGFVVTNTGIFTASQVSSSVFIRLYWTGASTLSLIYYDEYQCYCGPVSFALLKHSHTYKYYTFAIQFISLNRHRPFDPTKHSRFKTAPAFVILCILTLTSFCFVVLSCKGCVFVKLSLLCAISGLFKCYCFYGNRSNTMYM